MLLASALGQIGLPGGGFGLQLHLDQRHRRPAGGDQHPRHDLGPKPGRYRHPGGADRRPAAGTRSDDSIQRPRGDLPRHQADLLGGRQSVPPPPGPEPPGAGMAGAGKPSSCTSRGGRRPPGAPTSCSRRPRRWSATNISASARDRWIIAMKQVVPPIAEARSDFEIFSALADRLGFGEDYHEGKDEMTWLRDFWDRGRERAARYDVALPEFDAFWEEGQVQLPEGDCDFVFLRDFRNRSGTLSAGARRRDGSSCSRKPSPASATTTARAIPAWLEPAEWLGNAKDEAPLHMISSHPQHRLQQSDGQRPGGRGSEDPGPRAVLGSTLEDAAARGNRRWGGRAAGQRPRRLPRRYPGHRPGPAGRRHAGGRRLVRPRPARRARRAGQARQSQRADPRRGHVGARPGLHRPDHDGPNW